MWAVLFGSLFLFAAVGVFYITVRTHKLAFIQKIGQKHKILSWVLSLFPIVIAGAFSVINKFASIIILLHLMLIWVICDLIGLIINKARGRRPEKYLAGIAAICLTTVYLSYGWFCAHHVFETDYKLTTQKDIGSENIRIALIADSHIGTTLDGEKFAEQIERISKTSPDVLVVAGDFADDDTLKKDMIKSCEALGKAKTKYGVFFSYGNHDKGYYSYRDFTDKDLRAELSKNNVTVLEDESVLIDDRFYIIGRQDTQVSDRADTSSLTKPLDKDKYKIVIDHEPNDYDGEQGFCDLVLSGHTHGGHIFPAGFVGLWLKANDMVYGTQQRGGTDFVVTSGISGWAIPFKTGAVSEYVIIDVS